MVAREVGPLSDALRAPLTDAERRASMGWYARELVGHRLAAVLITNRLDPTAAVRPARCGQAVGSPRFAPRLAGVRAF